MTEWFDQFKYMTVKDFGAYVRGLNSRFESRFASLEEVWAIINKLSATVKRVADDEASLHPTVRALIKENEELKARLAKMESEVTDLQKATFPLRPRAVKAEFRE